MENGEFEFRVGSAATLTLVEEQFRQLSEKFMKAGVKKSECDKMAQAQRGTVVWDLCVKPVYAKLGFRLSQVLQAKRMNFSTCSK